MPAGVEIGVSTAKSAMAIAWGDAWTNMIHTILGSASIRYCRIRCQKISWDTV